MYNDSYTTETDFIPTPEITLAEARTKAKYHEKIISANKGELTNEQLADDYERLNYYNYIILKRSKK